LIFVHAFQNWANIQFLQMFLPFYHQATTKVKLAKGSNLAETSVIVQGFELKVNKGG
jgi:uncharacterized membrane protein